MSCGVDAGNAGGNIRLPLRSRPGLICPRKADLTPSFRGVEAIFYGIAWKVNLMDGLRFSEGALLRLLSSPLFFLPSLHPLERGKASTGSLYVAVGGERSKEQWRAARCGRKPLYNFTPNLFHNGANKKLSRTTYSHHGRG